MVHKTPKSQVTIYPENWQCSNHSSNRPREKFSQFCRIQISSERLHKIIKNVLPKTPRNTTTKFLQAFWNKLLSRGKHPKWSIYHYSQQWRVAFLVSDKIPVKFTKKRIEPSFETKLKRNISERKASYNRSAKNRAHCLPCGSISWAIGWKQIKVPKIRFSKNINHLKPSIKLQNEIFRKRQHRRKSDLQHNTS